MVRHIAAVAVTALVTATTLFAQAEYGVVEFETTCNAAAQEDLNTAVALLHHMMYERSEAAFEEAAAADSECAMAHWGVAMTQLHPLWAPPNEEQMKRGREAVERARSVGTTDAREQAYIDAIAAFFETPGDFGPRLAAWEEAHRNLYASYPGDEDAGAFAALAKLAVAPKSDKSFAAQKKAGSLTEELHEAHPRHPGFFHYTIHAYDNPALADRALEVARGYDQLAPEVPHALHMPSHIFVRVGEWEDVVDWNTRSAEAALKHSSHGMTSLHYPHAIDYLVYARLQQGRDSGAEEAIQDLKANGPYQPDLASAYALAAAPARVVLERRDWGAAADLSLRDPENFPWEKFPAAESITWFTRGLGAARTGDMAGAEKALEHLDALYERLSKDPYWSVLTDAQRKAVAAWLAYAEGDEKEALQTMQAAADIEDSVDKHPVTPGAVLPSRELLGEMLLLMDRPEEALAAFEASLDVSANRLNSLTGAGRAAELAGDKEKASSYYGAAASLVADADAVDRPRIEEARRMADD